MLGIMDLKLCILKDFGLRLILVYLGFGIVILKDVTKLISVSAVIML